MQTGTSSAKTNRGSRHQRLFSIVPKALGMLLLTELIVVAMLVMLQLPAIVSPKRSISMDFVVTSAPASYEYPFSASFGPDSELESITCKPLVMHDAIRLLPCEYIAGDLMPAFEYLRSQGFTLIDGADNLSIRPVWGADNLFWNLLCILAFGAGWMWYSKVDWNADLGTLRKTCLKRPHLLLAPYALSVVTVSLSMMLFKATGAGQMTGITGAISVRTIVLAIVAAPVLEELVFRGLMFDMLKSTMHWKLAALFSSVSFVAIHQLQLQMGWGHLAGLFATGFGLCWLRWRTGSLTVCILAHALVNAIVILSQYRQA
jgi:membrane protease YdiL (CAAX protease family)